MAEQMKFVGQHKNVLSEIRYILALYKINRQKYREFDRDFVLSTKICFFFVKTLYKGF